MRGSSMPWRYQADEQLYLAEGQEGENLET